jgi:tRNA A37 methylthiotransferase MiaB
MPGQHNNATKEARSRAAIAVAAEMSREYRENLIGTTHEVLFEESEDGFAVGHAPNYVKFYVETKEDLHNQLRTVTVTEVYKDGVIGQITG